MGRTTFKDDLEAAAILGHIVIFGAASGPADPISPNAFIPNTLTVSGGNLHNYLRTREELTQRANDFIAGIRAGWLKLHIGQVLPLAQAARKRSIALSPWASAESLGHVNLFNLLEMRAADAPKFAYKSTVEPSARLFPTSDRWVALTDTVFLES